MLANGREPKSCLGQLFNFKLGSFAVWEDVRDANARPHLKLKTQPRFHPARLSLSMFAVRARLECSCISY
jgi:hypothetical protein